MTMGATLGWSTATVLLGFLVMTGLVVALATSSTARYEFERNGARERQRSEARAPAPIPPAAAPRSRPPGQRRRSRDPRRSTSPSVPLRRWRPADRAGGWSTSGGRRWPARSPTGSTPTGPRSPTGCPPCRPTEPGSADGSVALRPSPEERAWLAELGDQLDRLPADWDELLTDTDPLTTLLVEVAAALVESGLPLHDAPQGDPTGGAACCPSRSHGACSSAGGPTTG